LHLSLLCQRRHGNYLLGAGGGGGDIGLELAGREVGASEGLLVELGVVDEEATIFSEETHGGSTTTYVWRKG